MDEREEARSECGHNPPIPWRISSCLSCVFAQVAELERDLTQAREERDAHQAGALKRAEYQREAEDEVIHLRAALAEVRQILTAEYKVRNLVGNDICDLCGGDVVWPNHKPECVIGQALARAEAGEQG